MPCSCSPFRGFDIVRGKVDGVVSRNWQPEGGWRYSKLDPHRDFLIRRLAEQDDITMPELAAELAGHGTVVAPSSTSRWLIRNGYRFKKNATGQRTGSSRRCSRAPDLGRPPAEDAA